MSPAPPSYGVMYRRHRPPEELAACARLVELEGFDDEVFDLLVQFGHGTPPTGCGSRATTACVEYPNMSW